MREYVRALQRERLKVLSESINKREQEKKILICCWCKVTRLVWREKEKVWYCKNCGLSL